MPACPGGDWAAEEALDRGPDVGFARVVEPDPPGLVVVGGEIDGSQVVLAGRLSSATRSLYWAQTSLWDAQSCFWQADEQHRLIEQPLHVYLPGPSHMLHVRGLSPVWRTVSEKSDSASASFTIAPAERQGIHLVISWMRASVLIPEAATSLH